MGTFDGSAIDFTADCAHSWHKVIENFPPEADPALREKIKNQNVKLLLCID